MGAALIVTGTVVLTPDAPQPLEVKADTIMVEGTSTPDYPLQKKRHSVEFLRTIQHLRPRSNLFSAVFRIRSAAAHAVHILAVDYHFRALEPVFLRPRAYRGIERKRLTDGDFRTVELG